MKPLYKAAIAMVIAIVFFLIGYSQNSLFVLVLTGLVCILGLYWIKKAGGFFASSRKRKR